MTNSNRADALERRARLANIRQEMLAPVGAIVSYSEMLLEDASANGPEEILQDLERIQTAAQELHGMADRLMDPETADALFVGHDEVTAQKKLRHDLRTPINAVKGYGEMILEDLEDLCATRLEADLSALLMDANQLLDQIDKIVDFGTRVDEDMNYDTTGGAVQASEMFASLAASLKPLQNATDRLAVTGSILVVDDLESNRTVLARRLARDKHRVKTAESGEHALRLMAAEEFDLILLDLMMPGMNGLEVLEQLKADEKLHQIPVIMISALDEIDSVVRCIEAGAEDYLPKPFNPVLLKARISAALEKRCWRDREQQYLDRLEAEKEKFENLLLNILPRQIIDRLNEGETIIADRFDNVSILFSDLVGFTSISSEMPPADLVTRLNDLFSEFDMVAKELGVEKIKMIGDAYMVAAGVPEARFDHAELIARMGMRMIDIVVRLNKAHATPFQIRIGVHSGPVVAGIIGTHRFIYDVWGDTVNVASRLESNGLPNRVQISKVTRDLLGPEFVCESRGDIELKGKGKLPTYLLGSLSDPATTDAIA